MHQNKSVYFLLIIMLFFWGGIASCSCNDNPANKKIQSQINSDRNEVKYIYNQSIYKYDYIKESTEEIFAISDIIHPDSLYRNQYSVLKDYFYGEAGHDLYNVWYAYNIAKLNSSKQSNKDREILNNVFYCINEILCVVSNGGTSFTHQKYRIPAYVEYYIYNYSCRKTTRNKISSKEIDEAINALWQIVSFYSEENTPIQLLALRLKDVYERIEYIKALIVNDIYLECVQDYMKQCILKN